MRYVVPYAKMELGALEYRNFVVPRKRPEWPLSGFSLVKDLWLWHAAKWQNGTALSCCCVLCAGAINH